MGTSPVDKAVSLFSSASPTPFSREGWVGLTRPRPSVTTVLQGQALGG